MTSEETDLTAHLGRDEDQLEDGKQLDDSLTDECDENGSAGPLDSSLTSTNATETEEPIPDANFGGLDLEPERKKEILIRILSNVPDAEKLKFRSVAKLWKCAIDDPEMVRIHF